MEEKPQNVCSETQFRDVFQRWARGLRNFLFYKTGNEQEAEDLTQEAFLRLWRSCAKVKPEKAKSFLFTVANNLFLDQVKHEKVVFQFRRQVVANPVSQETPEYLYEADEFADRLQKAIEALPEKSRVVFLMNRVDNLTYQEIADRLGISKKAVEKRMSKALEALRKLTSQI